MQCMLVFMIVIGLAISLGVSVGQRSAGQQSNEAFDSEPNIISAAGAPILDSRCTVDAAGGTPYVMGDCASIPRNPTRVISGQRLETVVS